MNNTEHQAETVNSFRLDWPYVSDVRRELHADGFDINPTPKTFKSGRPIYEAVFYTGRGHAKTTIARRQAMMLKSKTTQKPYYVCRTYDVSDRQTHADHMAAAAEDLVSSLLMGADENTPPGPTPPITILKRQMTNGR